MFIGNRTGMGRLWARVVSSLLMPGLIALGAGPAAAQPPAPPPRRGRKPAAAKPATPRTPPRRRREARRGPQPAPPPPAAPRRPPRPHRRRPPPRPRSRAAAVHRRPRRPPPPPRPTAARRGRCTATHCHRSWSRDAGVAATPWPPTLPPRRSPLYDRGPRGRQGHRRSPREEPAGLRGLRERLHPGRPAAGGRQLDPRAATRLAVDGDRNAGREHRDLHPRRRLDEQHRARRSHGLHVHRRRLHPASARRRVDVLRSRARRDEPRAAGNAARP